MELIPESNQKEIRKIRKPNSHKSQQNITQHQNTFSPKLIRQIPKRNRQTSPHNIKQQNIYYTIDSGVYRFKFEIFEQQEIKSIGVVFSKEFRILQQP